MSQLDSYRSREANMALARKLKIGVWIITAVILLLVASNRGVSVLPDWVVRQLRHNADFAAPETS